MPDNETDYQFENEVWHDIQQNLARSMRMRQDRAMNDILTNGFSTEEQKPSILPKPSIMHEIRRRITNAWGCLRYGWDFDDYGW